MNIKFGLVLSGLCALLLAPDVVADDNPFGETIGHHCQFLFGNGTAEQPDGFTPWLGPVQMRIGGTVVDGSINLLATDGFDDFDFNEVKADSQLVGFAKGTYDFGELGAFHFWETDTLTFPDPDFLTADLDGNQRTGPSRDGSHVPFTPWGTGVFADTDADLRVKGWIEFGVVKPDGSVVNALSYFVWGKICNVDLVAVDQ